MINAVLTIALVPLLFGAFETNSFQTTFCNIAIFGISDLIQCDEIKDTLTLREGQNITLTMDNSTDTITIDAATGAQPSELYCSGDDKFSAYNSTTNTFVCTTDQQNPTGEANTASNLSPGEGLFTSKSGVNLPFKSLTGGTNISLSSNSTTIEISATGTGEANTYSDVGLGEQIIKNKVGVDLPFKGIAAGSGISVSGNLTDVTISSTIVDTNTETFVDTTTCSVGDFVTSINNSTGVVTCGTPETFAYVDTTTCSAGSVITAINNSTGVVTCTALSSSYSLGFTQGADIAKSSTLYFGITGGNDVTENNVEFYLPNDRSVSKLYCFVSASTTNADSTITLRLNNADTSVSLTYTAGETGLKSDTVNSFSVNAGDTINIAVTNTSSGGGAKDLSLQACSMELS
ncbi:hypothetical protein QIT54_gp16 [Nitrosopumilus spindle-shaped virus]|uniref:Uncharacterized protein n=1 Tax=Nitrosopumilus spindle-shaped virus TaxID=2508184 RepID=A0A514K2V8_9VIRU|nr:hypothetical protein QIT54_gp16 [Nitrosopumilus spindle-shaped virus]QDI73954.1 hypothetical protein [Nitrosopumilus spindle-shaped virus]